MKKLRFIMVLFLAVSVSCFGQNSSNKELIKVEQPINGVYTEVDEMPVFPGGKIEMHLFISKNIRYPETEKNDGVEGTVYITFVVESDGRISNAKILRGVSGGPACDNEALRVIQMMPLWTPGKNKGLFVPVQVNLPIKFTLK